MTGTKKPLSHPRPELRAACEQLSKAALIDLVGDAMDTMFGEDDWRVKDLIEWIEPRLLVRGDREPQTWKALRPRPRPQPRPPFTAHLESEKK